MKGKGKLILGGMILGCLAIGLGGFLYWFFLLRFEEYTDDAYVQGNQVWLTSQISGFITSITADDTEMVQKGRLLITLDPTDSQLALKRGEDQLAKTVRNVVGLFEKVGELKAEREIR